MDRPHVCPSHTIPLNLQGLEERNKLWEKNPGGEKWKKGITLIHAWKAMQDVSNCISSSSLPRFILNTMSSSFL